MNLNKAMIIGNLTQDPEVRNTPGGQTVASFGVATNFIWTDQSGQRQQKAEFHNIVAWRKLAEICGQYLKKGAKIYIEGRLQTRDWVGQDGVKRYRTEIVADNMIMLDRPIGSGGAAPRPAEQPSAPAEEPVINVDENSGDYSEDNSNKGDSDHEEDIKLESIPF